MGIHLAEAGRWADALHALCDGIRHTYVHGDRRPLMAEIERGERCADRAGLPAIDPHRARLSQLRCIVSLSLGRVEDAVAAGAAAWRVAEALQDRRLMSEAAMRLVDAHSQASDWTAAEAWASRFLGVEEAAPKPHFGGIVRARLGRIAELAGDEAAAQRWFREADALLQRCLRRTEDPLGVLGAMVELYAWWDDRDRLVEVAEQTVRDAAEAGQVAVQLYALSKLVEAAIGRERWDDARDAGRRALDLAALSGDLRTAVFLRGQLANVELQAGDWGAARRWARSAVDRVGMLRHPWLEAVLYLFLTDSDLGLADFDAFDRSLARLEAVVPRVPPSETQIVDTLRGWVVQLDQMGQSERALAVEEVIAVAHTAFARSTPDA
jgi:tetratricopeptide (TPR) repeat protein